MTSFDHPSYVEEMLLAIKANIEYLRQEGSNQIYIKNGILLNNTEDFFIYQFELEFFQDIEPDTEVEVRIQRENIDGKIVKMQGKSLQIALSKNIGVKISEARIILSSYYLLELLKEKLQKFTNGEITFTNLPRKVFKPEKSKAHSDQKYTLPSSSNTLNVYQEKALRLALGSEVSFIWGPPGTGKTMTIARMIEGFLSRNLTVLLISHTNIATDGVLLKVVEHFQGTEDYENGRLIREGTIQKDELKKYTKVVPELVLEEKAKPLKDEIRRYEKKIQDISQKLESIKGIIEKFKSLASLDQQSDSTSEDIKNRSKYVSERKSSMKRSKQELSTAEENIKKSQSMNKLKRFILRLNLEKLLEQKAKLLKSIEQDNALIKSNTDIVRDEKSKLEKIDQQQSTLKAELRGKDFQKFEKEFSTKQQELGDQDEQRRLLEKQLEELGEDILKEAKVIATTLTKSYSSKALFNRKYDCVVIDEASMAPLPALWCATGLAEKHVVVVGDFYQLPPIAKHKVITKGKTKEEIQQEEEVVAKWLKKDVFEISDITNSIHNQKKPKYLEQLQKQYRMHPDIAKVINKLVYGKNGKQFELESDVSTEESGIENLNKEPLAGSHIGIYDTAKIHTLAARTDSGSFYNLYHAFLAVKLAKQALESGYEMIGIVSPFRAQINLLQKMLRDEGIDERVKADTVHRFQGGERELIIFDVTTAQRTKLTDDDSEGGDDEKLINVALSRAKEKCIVIADCANIIKKHSDTSLIKEFIKYCDTNGAPIISAQDLLPRYDISDESEEWLSKIYDIKKLQQETNDSSIFDETNFYQNFTRDMLLAEKEVIIESPFLTSERVSKFLPLFEHLKAKGVRIYVITRHPSAHTGLMKDQAEIEAKNLEDMGIIVLPMGRAHRKVSLIDRRILWEGSLNILSQRRSEEIMRRFSGEEVAKQIMNFLGLQKNIGSIGENKLQKCEFCKSVGAWYWTSRNRWGRLWTHCLVGNHALGKPPKTPEEIEKAKDKVRKLRKAPKKFTDSGVPICQEHELEMEKRTGKYGEFWGCPEYPQCRNTENM